MFSFIRRLFSRKAPKPEIPRVEKAKENIHRNYMATHHERQAARRKAALKIETINTSAQSGTTSTHFMLKHLHAERQKLKAQEQERNKFPETNNVIMLSNSWSTPDHEQVNGRIERRTDEDANPIAAFINADSFGLHRTEEPTRNDPVVEDTAAADEAARATDYGSSSSDSLSSYSSSNDSSSSDSSSSSSTDY